MPTPLANGDIITKDTIDDGDGIFEYTTVGGEIWMAEWRGELQVDAFRVISPDWEKGLPLVGNKIEYTQLTPAGQILRFVLHDTGDVADFAFYVIGG